jgi:hypothetical protein
MQIQNHLSHQLNSFNSRRYLQVYSKVAAFAIALLLGSMAAGACFILTSCATKTTIIGSATGVLSLIIELVRMRCLPKALLKEFRETTTQTSEQNEKKELEEITTPIKPTVTKQSTNSTMSRIGTISFPDLNAQTEQKMVGEIAPSGLISTSKTPKKQHALKAHEKNNLYLVTRAAGLASPGLERITAIIDAKRIKPENREGESKELNAFCFLEEIDRLSKIKNRNDNEECQLRCLAICHSMLMESYDIVWENSQKKEALDHPPA